MKILCIGYRTWALSIYSNLKKNFPNYKIKILKKKKYLSYKLIKKFNPKLILFYGWSWMINEKIFKNYTSLMLHPSDLPKFRGGSPIQNQIISGVKKSAVTIFKVNNILDGGPIYKKKFFMLTGGINKIFTRIENIGTNLTIDIIKGKYRIYNQNLKNSVIYKRRSPKDSEITLNEIKNMNGQYLLDKIQMLEDPYPNAYIKTKDNKKLLIRAAKIVNN
jgi:methionyl-tRNA formyltransferase